MTTDSGIFGTDDFGTAGTSQDVPLGSLYLGDGLDFASELRTDSPPISSNNGIGHNTVASRMVTPHPSSLLPRSSDNGKNAVRTGGDSSWNGQSHGSASHGNSNNKLLPRNDAVRSNNGGRQSLETLICHEPIEILGIGSKTSTESTISPHQLTGIMDETLKREMASVERRQSLQQMQYSGMLSGSSSPSTGTSSGNSPSTARRASVSFMNPFLHDENEEEEENSTNILSANSTAVYSSNRSSPAQTNSDHYSSIAHQLDALHVPVGPSGNNVLDVLAGPFDRPSSTEHHYSHDHSTSDIFGSIDTVDAENGTSLDGMSATDLASRHSVAFAYGSSGSMVNYGNGSDNISTSMANTSNNANNNHMMNWPANGLFELDDAMQSAMSFLPMPHYNSTLDYQMPQHSGVASVSGDATVTSKKALGQDPCMERSYSAGPVDSRSNMYQASSNPLGISNLNCNNSSSAMSFYPYASTSMQSSADQIGDSGATSTGNPSSFAYPPGSPNGGRRYSIAMSHAGPYQSQIPIPVHPSLYLNFSGQTMLAPSVNNGSHFHAPGYQQQQHFIVDGSNNWNDMSTKRGAVSSSKVGRPHSKSVHGSIASSASMSAGASMDNGLQFVIENPADSESGSSSSSSNSGYSKRSRDSKNSMDLSVHSNSSADDILRAQSIRTGSATGMYRNGSCSSESSNCSTNSSFAGQYGRDDESRKRMSASATINSNAAVGGMAGIALHPLDEQTLVGLDDQALFAAGVNGGADMNKDDVNRRHSMASQTQFFCCPWPGCSKVFNRFYNLRSHYRIHSGEKPYACRFCDASFARNHDLKRHERIHSSDKPFICDVCLKSFSRNDALSRHQRLNSCVPVAPAVVSSNDASSLSPIIGSSMSMATQECSEALASIYRGGSVNH